MYGHASTLKQYSCGLKEKHEERRSMVIKELTLQNTANGSTTALQTAEHLEWRNRLSDDVETSKWEALASSGRRALSVDRDFDATIVCGQEDMDGTIGID